MKELTKKELLQEVKRLGKALEEAQASEVRLREAEALAGRDAQ